MQLASIILLALGLALHAQAEERLPALKDGYHASAEHEHFSAVVQGNGTLAIHLKKDGQRIPGLQPILIKPECQAQGQTGWFDRKPVNLTAKQEPTDKATKITFEGKTKEGVTFTQHYAIQKDRIQAWGACEDPDKLTPPTDFRIRAQVLRTHLLEDNAPDDEVSARVKDSIWAAKTSKGEVKLPLDERQSLTKMPELRSVGVLKVASSDWQGLGIEITAPRAKHGQIQVWNYPEQALYRGFSASLHKEDPSNDSKSGALTLRINPTR